MGKGFICGEVAGFLLVPALSSWELAFASGQSSSGPKDTPEKPKPGGHCLMLELPVGGGIAKAKPPREFPFWKLGTSAFNDIFQGRGKGHRALAGFTATTLFV